nr:hypothetical protein [Escherichia coli]EEX7143751.1 hypothetical protein [Escherichia coli]EFO7754966.1 hypothetical protein [Escherichia coli]EIU7275265.1 hypothetical protein [Escherichia coli]EIZ7927162.1 hypothetical protein [Escherichia coli]
MFYVDYCFVDLAFDIETDSMTAKNDIINECTPLKERNKTLKERNKTLKERNKTLKEKYKKMKR